MKQQSLAVAADSNFEKLHKRTRAVSFGDGSDFAMVRQHSNWECNCPRDAEYADWWINHHYVFLASPVFPLHV
jgi:hypothetical protein